MKYGEILERAKETIRAESIADYRPAVMSLEPDTFLDGVEVCVPNTIMVWLKNGDSLWYRVKDEHS